MEDKFSSAGNQLQTHVSSLSKPSLGKCWDDVPAMRFIIDDQYQAILNEVSTTKRTGEARSCLGEQIEKNQRIVRVAKSCFTATGSECIINVGDIGMF